MRLLRCACCLLLLASAGCQNQLGSSSDPLPKVPRVPVPSSDEAMGRPNSRPRGTGVNHQAQSVERRLGFR